MAFREEERKRRQKKEQKSQENVLLKSQGYIGMRMWYISWRSLDRVEVKVRSAWVPVMIGIFSTEKYWRQACTLVY